MNTRPSILFSNRKQMNLHSDVLKLIVSKLDNNSIKNLSLVPDIWNEISLFARDEYFWFLRTQELIQRDISWKEEDWKEVYYIISSSRKIDNDQDNALAASILLSLGVDPTGDDNMSIRWVCVRGHSRILRLLLEDGRADPTTGNNICIIRACEDGHTEVVRLLLEDGRANPSLSHNHILFLASDNGHLKIIKLLLQDKRVISSKHLSHSLNQSLECAHMNENKQVVNFLTWWMKKNLSLFSDLF